MSYTRAMRSRTHFRVLLVAALTLAFLPMLSSFAPGGQVAGFTTASPAAADQIWYQSVGRASETAACEKSTVAELAAGWTQWAPSWAKWGNGGNGGFVCDRSGSSSLTCAAGAGATGTCVLGATGPGGGKVFYVNEAATTGARYMEAAPIGWNTGADRALAWDVNTGGTNCFALVIAGAVGTAIGTGRANTKAITAACTAAQAPAAWAARNYTGGGVSWFLPSQDELRQLFLQRAVVGGFDAGFYWSSSNNDRSNAWARNFGGGSPMAEVLPVRAF